MESKNAAFDESSDREIIEKIGKRLPNIGVSVLAHTFVVKAIDLGDLTALMVPT